jgi:hypothetical protein
LAFLFFLFSHPDGIAVKLFQDKTSRQNGITGSMQSDFAPNG